MDWQQTACILCECNCGIEVRIGGADGRRLERIRGDKAHPASRGYTCEKALRLDHYQNGRGERVLHPLRRRPDGTFEAVSWERAVTEIAARLNAVREAHGGETILYYGGGGQGNHLGGAYGNALFRGLGGRFRSTAIAQEKTGEIWVNGRMFGTGVRGDFAHCEVALFIGKNPWHTHGIPHARSTLKAIANDPGRAMVVIDPRRTETAQLAEHHLAVRPGRDAWLIAAMAATIVDEHLADTAWLAAHTTGADAVLAALRAIPIGRYCEIAGVPETDVRAAARRIARASSVAVFEDLGVQMNRHSTLVSYLEKLLWLLTGNLGRPGAQYAFSTLIPLAKASRAELGADGPRSPVVGARIVAGLLPCNVMAEEILADHPARYRALIVESGNPLHSVADSGQFRRAMAALELSVVIDVFLTETARAADYVLPALTQYEKFEATLFNFEFPRNVFHLRRPVLAPPDTPDGPLAEPEIHCRIAEAAGLYGEAELAPLRAAAADGRGAFLAALQSLLGERPQLGGGAPAGLPSPRTAPADPGRDERGGGRRAPAGPAQGRRPQRRGRAPRRLRRGWPPPTPCSTPSWPRRRAWCSPTTPTTPPGNDSPPPTGGSSCSSTTSWPSWPPSSTRSHRGPPTTGRCCCRPGSAGPSPPTRSCGTPGGVDPTPTARCASAPPTPSASVCRTGSAP
ncbi:MAG: molybdopterin-dependent oxidoreductase [Acidimicrobiales bacterium]